MIQALQRIIERTGQPGRATGATAAASAAILLSGGLLLSAAVWVCRHAQWALALAERRNVTIRGIMSYGSSIACHLTNLQCSENIWIFASPQNKKNSAPW